MEQKVLRTGTWVVVCAIVLRLICGMADSFVPNLSPKIVSFMIFMQTGRVVRPNNISFSPQPTQPTEETQPAPPPPTEPELPVFSAGEANEIGITAGFSYTVDKAGLLTQPLNWDLTGEEPKVLIIHSHGSESFAPTGEYQETTAYHTLNTDYNMVAVGTYLAQLLTQAGIGVIHDRQIHDSPSYNAAYSNSRTSVQAYLAQYPTIQVVLDLHRDAAEYADGSQYATSATVDGKKVAQLMFVVGSDASGNYHPNWQENLATALKLQALLEQQAPGITRQTILRAQRFNHDLSAAAMIVEVGAAGNTLEEAMGAIPILAEALIQLMYGANP